MVQINDVKNDARANRTSAHTHIKGLGLKTDGYADRISSGFVGQTAAREVCKRSEEMITVVCAEHYELAKQSSDCALPTASALPWLPQLTRCRIGVRCGRRPDQSEKDVWESSTTGRRTRHRKDSTSIGSIARARHTGTVLSDRGKRDILYRSKEDGGIDGELQTSYRYVDWLYVSHRSPLTQHVLSRSSRTRNERSLRR